MTAFGGIGFCCCGDEPCDHLVTCGGYDFSGAISLSVPASSEPDITACWSGGFNTVNEQLVTFYGYDVDETTLVEANVKHTLRGCLVFYAVSTGNVVVCGNQVYSGGGTVFEGCELEPLSGYWLAPEPGVGADGQIPIHLPIWTIIIDEAGVDGGGTPLYKIDAYCALANGGVWPFGDGQGSYGGFARYSETFTITDLQASNGPFTLTGGYITPTNAFGFPTTVEVSFLDAPSAQELVCSDPPVQCSPAIPYPNLVAQISRSGGDGFDVCLGRVNRSHWIGFGVVECSGVVESVTLEIICDEVDGWLVRFTNDSGSWTSPVTGTIPTAMSFGPLGVTLCGVSDSLSGIINSCEEEDHFPCCPSWGCCPPTLIQPSATRTIPTTSSALYAADFDLMTGGAGGWSAVLTLSTGYDLGSGYEPQRTETFTVSVFCDEGTWKMTVSGGTPPISDVTVEAETALCDPLELLFQTGDIFTDYDGNLFGLDIEVLQ